MERKLDSLQSLSKFEEPKQVLDSHLIIGIDIGHNVSCDIGANGIRFEDELNAIIGNELISRLGSTNARVVNCTPSTATSLTDSLRQRCTVANSNGCDIFISIHHNAGGGTGCEALMYPGDTSGDLGNVILCSLEAVGLRNRGIKLRDDLFVLSQTSMPALIIECAFVDNANDMGNYNYKNVANAIFEGLYSYYNLETSTATPPDTSGTTYTVVKGDTLYGISRRFNTTVDKIARRNSISNVNLIYPGQTLIIE